MYYRYYLLFLTFICLNNSVSSQVFPPYQNEPYLEAYYGEANAYTQSSFMARWSPWMVGGVLVVAAIGFGIADLHHHKYSSFCHSNSSKNGLGCLGTKSSSSYSRAGYSH